MDTPTAILTMIGKVAEQDGKISPVEKAFIKMVANQLNIDDPDKLLQERNDFDIETLLQHITQYEDLFIIALRASHTAHADDEFGLEEILMINKLLIGFAITPSDRLLIKSTSPDMTLDQLCAEFPRFKELYESSSIFPMGKE